MKPRIVHTAIAVTVLACSSAPAPAPVAAPANPARGLRNLNDPQAGEELIAIVVAAARELPLAGSSGARPLFSGVYVNGRRSREASQAVARSAGLTEVSSTRPPKVECGIQNMSTGERRPTPCPASLVSSLPPNFSFAEVRATADSAYVGVNESGARSTRASCITLARAGGGWRVLGNQVAADARHCGR